MVSLLSVPTLNGLYAELGFYLSNKLFIFMH